ncbi:hypothetical protein AK812_SmicGene42812 [Symbiodinium microadriaticum]|uniref:Uncharacterized protein n=1 Tax=Symbiodinium microadriaticum TaxID=2951 RepID=A0A1Q9C2M4_SYMMI|nr:hypothetical protein AK812_SmicGene42812 [Symbiodinium microadriaticum]
MAKEMMITSFKVTAEVQPSYDARSTWFAYEDAINDWCGITELDNDSDKGGPDNGVKYFKSFLRPLFVKGTANVFLYRFQQFMNLSAHSQQDLQQKNKMALPTKKRWKEPMRGAMVLVEVHRAVLRVNQSKVRWYGKDYKMRDSTKLVTSLRVPVIQVSSRVNQFGEWTFQTFQPSIASAWTVILAAEPDHAIIHPVIPAEWMIEDTLAPSCILQYSDLRQAYLFEALFGKKF